jgi:uncharacterized alkaline shock family protein YloU
MVFGFTTCLSYLKQNGQNEVSVHDNENAKEQKWKVKFYLVVPYHKNVIYRNIKDFISNV